MWVLVRVALLLALATASTGERYYGEVTVASKTGNDKLRLEFEDGACSELDNAGFFENRLPDEISKMYIIITVVDKVNIRTSVYIPILRDMKCDGDPVMVVDLPDGDLKAINFLGVRGLSLMVENVRPLSANKPKASPSGVFATDGFVVSDVGFEDQFSEHQSCSTPTHQLSVPQSDYCHKPSSSIYYYKLNCLLPSEDSTEGILMYTVSRDDVCNDQQVYEGLPSTSPTSVFAFPGDCRTEYLTTSLAVGSELPRILSLDPVRVWAGYCRAQISCSRLVECGNETDTRATQSQVASCLLSDAQAEYCLLPLRPQYCDWIIEADSPGVCGRQGYRIMTSAEKSLCNDNLDYDTTHCFPDNVNVPIVLPDPPIPTTSAPASTSPFSLHSGDITEQDGNIISLVLGIFSAGLFIATIFVVCVVLRRNRKYNFVEELEVDVISTIEPIE